MPGRFRQRTTHLLKQEILEGNARKQPTLTRSDLDGGQALKPAANKIPVGWRGKGPSNKEFQESGARNIFDRSYRIGFNVQGDRDQDSPDERKQGRNDKGNGSGDKNGDKDGEEPDGIDAQVLSLETVEVGHSEAEEDDDSNIFQEAYVRKANSLYTHSYEDEIRRHMQISKSIKAEYFKTGDKVTHAQRLLDEEWNWMEREPAKSPWEEQNQLQLNSCDFEDNLWRLRKRPVLVRSIERCSYNKCFKFWESDLLGAKRCDTLAFKSDEPPSFMNIDLYRRRIGIGVHHAAYPTKWMQIPLEIRKIDPGSDLNYDTILYNHHNSTSQPGPKWNATNVGDQIFIYAENIPTKRPGSMGFQVQ
ncbi:predicted protein [Sclerotinia sclerotiorum 1980 UF-70]|uniref:Uncharacterized protein n=1 Tax=Sclerotinia sclerotiorum (strain ATCC 18683 / 1980 / Ss-1) TaxID=665079 RepID=A7E8N2_SCLS1|nr:predicted protein [Sclerotinia sclerotiorum 1980 UF-70]EDN96734.1 predicted protein [Sclerotinia sclerotiorum 1980 UF-70]